MKKSIPYLISLLVLTLTGHAADVGYASPKPVAQLQEEFLELKFGMFLHYNMATYTDEEWVVGYPDPSTFDPGGPIDTDQWADAAVAAGMKYAVLTAKHVSGFCLWDSQYTTYDVMHPDCPVQEDIVAKFIESFTSRGLKVGLYYHWRHPGFGDPDKHKVLPPECDPADHDLATQKDFQLKQIAELLEKYPECFYFWNDAYDPKLGTAEELLAFERGINPNLLTSSNWWNWGKKGTPYLDIGVKELRMFPEDNQAPGETCWSLAGKWFWKTNIKGYAKAENHVKRLKAVNARNSNYLLNVPPNRKGLLDGGAVEELKKIGQILRSELK